jgi:hypothetical protein
MASCVIAALVTVAFLLVRSWLGRRSGRGRGAASQDVATRPARPVRATDRATRESWRMPQLAMLAPVQMSVARRVGMSAMWIYLGVAIALVVVRVIELAIGG